VEEDAFFLPWRRCRCPSLGSINCGRKGRKDGRLGSVVKGQRGIGNEEEFFSQTPSFI